jgi:hypothetical protein
MSSSSSAASPANPFMNKVGRGFYYVMKDQIDDEIKKRFG